MFAALDAGGSDASDWGVTFDVVDAGEDGKIQRGELLRYLTSAEFRSRPLSFALLAFIADGAMGPADVLMAASTRVEKAGTNAAGAGERPWRRRQSAVCGCTSRVHTKGRPRRADHGSSRPDMCARQGLSV
jgi:hypothetical protein